jgi:hypothetical protein
VRLVVLLELFPNNGRDRAVVVCCVSGLRGWGHCGVEVHGCGSRTVATGEEVLAGVVGSGVSALVCLFPRPVVWYFSVGWCGVVWCGVGTSVPVLEAGGVVSFSWHGDMAPWGIHGVSGRARCHVVAVAVLCGCAGPVGVGHYDMAGCGLSVGVVVVVSDEVVGGVEGTPCGSPPLGSPLLFSAPLLASCMPHIP